ETRGSVAFGERLHGSQAKGRLDPPSLVGAIVLAQGSDGVVDLAAPRPSRPAAPRAPAWTRITLIACPAESWRSRARRVRSSAAARRRSRSASLSARRGVAPHAVARTRRRH